MIDGIDDYVYLEPESHRYYDRDGGEYLSVSRLLSKYGNKDFENNKSAIIQKKAKARGVSEEVIVKEWDAMRDSSINHGNKIHNALERFDKTTTIKKEDENLRPLIISIAKEFSIYYRSIPEVILYHKKALVAGTTDRLLKKTSHKLSRIDFADYKTNLRRGIEYSNDYNQYMTGPLSHLMDCNYNKYSLQLSTYAYMYQLKTGCKIGKLSLVFIPPEDLLSWRLIPVPYMKREVELMFECYMDEKLSKPMLNAPAPKGFTLNEEDF